MLGSQGWAGDLEAEFYNRHACGPWRGFDSRRLHERPSREPVPGSGGGLLPAHSAAAFAAATPRVSSPLASSRWTTFAGT